MAEGQIGIRVRPDSKGFREDLQKILNRVERTMSVKIRADLDPARKAIESFRRQIRDVEVKVTADVREAKKALDDVTKGREAAINADADTAAASARLAVFTRPRWVDINARLNTASLVKVGNALAALSGARLVSDGIRNIGTSLSNLDRNLPKIAAVSLGVASIGSAALGSVQGLFSLGSALSSIAGAGLVLPALFAGFATSMVTLVAALRDAGTQLAPLGPQFSALQDAISVSFWQQARQPILDLATSVLPSLRAGLTQTSTALGGFTAELANALRASLTADAMRDLFGPLANSINIAKGALAPLVSAFVTLGTVGGQYLPRLAAWFVDISTAFDGWVQRNTENGNMFRWIDTGITNLKALGGVLRESGSILAGIAKAANAAGSGNGLTALADNLGKVADIVNREPFQGALTEVFRGAGEAMGFLGDALGPIGDMFVSLAPTISGVLSTAGEAVGGLLESLAGALEAPAFQEGLTAFFDGIKVGLDALGPALPALAGAFGSVAGFAGQLAAMLGPVLGAAVQALAPVITQVLTALQPLIPVLGATLISIIQQLAPLFPQLVTALLPLVDAFITILPSIVSLIPAVITLVSTLVPIISVAAQITAALAPIIAWIVQAIGWFVNFGLAISPLGAIIGLFTGRTQEMHQKVVAAITSMVQSVMAFFGRMGSNIRSSISTIVSVVLSGWNRAKATTASVWNAIVSTIRNIIGRVVSTVVNGATRAVATLVGKWNQARATTAAVFGNIASTVSSAVGRVISVVTGIGGRVRSALSGAGSWLVSAGRNMVNGMVNGLRGAMGRLISQARSMAQNAVSAVKRALGIQSPSRVFRDEVGTMIPAGIVEGLERGRQRLTATLNDLVEVPSVNATAGIEAGAGGAAGAPGGPTIQVVTSDPYVAAKNTVRLIELGAS